MTLFILLSLGLAAVAAAILLARPRASQAGSIAMRPSQALAISLVATVLVVAGLGYAWVGSPSLVAVTPDALRNGAAAPDAAAALDAIADHLHGRALAHPQDPVAWYKWARAELDRSRPEAAVDGYRHAIALRPNDADLLADGADIMAVASGGRLSGEPMQLVDRALAADPNQLKALALKGSEAALRRDFPAALAAWDRALKVAPPGDPIAAYLQRQEDRIHELAAQGAPATEGAPAASTPR